MTNTAIGVDLHKDSIRLMVLDEQVAARERRDLPTKCCCQIREYFASYGPRCQVAVESVGCYYWFWELLRHHVGRLVLADPAGGRAQAGRKAKTDRHDAWLLATLLHKNPLPMA